MPRNIHTMDLNLLSALDALIQERSVSRAAERLDLSQPAMSNALRRLRTLLDDPLLVRSGNAMVPTPRALEIQPVVRRTLEDLNNTLFGATTFDPSTHFEALTIATTDSDIAVFAAALHARLVAAGVPAPLRFLNLDPSYAQTLLESGAVALAVGALELAPETLRQMRLGEDSFTCVMRRGHALAGGPLTLDAYLAAEHILVAPLSGAPRGMIDSALAQDGRKRRIAVVVPSFFAALDLAGKTDLLATLPRRMAGAALDRSGHVSAHVMHEPAFLRHKIHIRAFWHPRFDKSPVNVWLRGEVRRAFRMPEHLPD